MKIARAAARCFSSTQSFRFTGRLSESLFSALRRGAPIDVHPEVSDALVSNRPVVALETAITTHGLPYPSNRDTALSLERIVRSTGSVPATVGIIQGRVKIGLNSSDLERLANPTRHSSAVKVSRRDIASAISLKKDGGTTISSTLIFAALAGIKVVATGGLGGVHRGGENSLDISADLPELSRCPVALVSAGVKAILDIGRTLEYLETLGVPVVTYSRNNDFPAFYYPRSGFKSPWRVDDPKTAAQLLFTQWQLGMENSVFFSVPIPEEYDELGQSLKVKVEQAVAELHAKGLDQTGNKTTPWLLSRIAELSQGESIKSNIALIENTALIGGQIAAEYSRLVNEQATDEAVYVRPDSQTSGLSTTADGSIDETILPPAKLLVLGSIAIDISAKATETAERGPSNGLHSTSPGTVSVSLGGVGRNIAEACHRILSSDSPSLRSATMLIATIGRDAFGQFLLEETLRIGMRTDGLSWSDKGSAVCNMVFDGSGSLIGGVADMDITQTIDSTVALRYIEALHPAWVALDGNLASNAIKAVVQRCNDRDIRTFFEPTSVVKSASIFPAVAAAFEKAPGRTPITATSPNILELTHMYNVARGNLTSHSTWWETIDSFSLGSKFRSDLEKLARQNASDDAHSKGDLAFLIDKGIAHMAITLLPFFKNIIVKCGESGVLAVLRISNSGAATPEPAVAYQANRRVTVLGHSSQEKVVLQHFPALELEQDRILSVTGAGDSFVGSLLASLVRNPAIFHETDSLSAAIASAQHAAVLALQSSHAVSPQLSSHVRGSC